MTIDDAKYCIQSVNANDLSYCDKCVHTKNCKYKTAHIMADRAFDTLYTLLKDIDTSIKHTKMDGNYDIGFIDASNYYKELIERYINEIESIK